MHAPSTATRVGPCSRGRPIGDRNLLSYTVLLYPIIFYHIGLDSCYPVLSCPALPCPIPSHLRKDKNGGDCLGPQAQALNPKP
jgi:hypothetical protein